LPTLGSTGSNKLHDAPHVSDKDTRVRVALPLTQAVELHQQLWELIPDSSD
jgi:hypothetical protein